MAGAFTWGLALGVSGWQQLTCQLDNVVFPSNPGIHEMCMRKLFDGACCSMDWCCAEGELAAEETEEELMARLGLKLEEELAQLDADKALDSRLAVRWAAQESARDRDQWQPLRSEPEPDTEGADTAIGRVLEFEDIDDFLFTLGEAQSGKNMSTSLA